jgi:hypothetical protein
MDHMVTCGLQKTAREEKQRLFLATAKIQGRWRGIKHRRRREIMENQVIHAVQCNIMYCVWIFDSGLGWLFLSPGHAVQDGDADPGELPRQALPPAAEGCGAHAVLLPGIPCALADLAAQGGVGGDAGQVSHAYHIISYHIISYTVWIFQWNYVVISAVRVCQRRVADEDCAPAAAQAGAGQVRTSSPRMPLTRAVWCLRYSSHRALLCVQAGEGRRGGAAAAG